jgi:hypothetical protein
MVHRVVSSKSPVRVTLCSVKTGENAVRRNEMLRAREDVKHCGENAEEARGRESAPYLKRYPPRELYFVSGSMNCTLSA